VGFLHQFFDTTEAVVAIGNAPHPSCSKRMTVVRDLVYDDSCADCCRYDLWLPRGGRAHPLLLYLHGGGFVSGDKSNRDGVAQGFCELGLAVCNANYGLSPTFRFPEPVRQIASALHHVCAHADGYGIDGRAVAVAGDSAGAYYASLLGALSARPELQERLRAPLPVPVCACVLNCGVYDVGALLREGMPFGLAEKICEAFSGCAASDLGAFCYGDVCSPASLVTADFPPSFVLQSARDVFCKGQGDRLVHALRAHGVTVHTYTARTPLDNHCFSLFTAKTASRRANGRVAAFLRAQCGLSPKNGEGVN